MHPGTKARRYKEYKAWLEARKGMVEWVNSIESTAAAADQLREKTNAVFGQIDTDDSGGIDEEELKNATSKIGLKLKDSVIHQMLVEADEDSNGVIDKDEFYLLMKAEMEAYFGKKNKTMACTLL